MKKGLDSKTQNGSKISDKLWSVRALEDQRASLPTKTKIQSALSYHKSPNSNNLDSPRDLSSLSLKVQRVSKNFSALLDYQMQFNPTTFSSFNQMLGFSFHKTKVLATEIGKTKNIRN